MVMIMLHGACLANVCNYTTLSTENILVQVIAQVIQFKLPALPARPYQPAAGREMHKNKIHLNHVVLL